MHDAGDGNTRILISSPLEKLVHFIVLCLAISAAIWIHAGVEELGRSCEARERDLRQFLALSQELDQASTTRTHALVDELGDELSHPRWRQALNGLRPYVVLTEVGPRIELIPSQPEPRLGPGPGGGAR